MTERAYTVTEIDALRRVIENKWLWGSYGLGRIAGVSRSYRESDKTIAVEQLTRTHMLAGHTAQDLYDSERPSANQTDEMESA